VPAPTRAPSRTAPPPLRPAPPHPRAVPHRPTRAPARTATPEPHPAPAQSRLALRPISWLVAGVTLVTALVVTALVTWRPAAELPGVVRDPMPVVGDLTFHDHSQGDEPRIVDLVPARGEITLVYFGYLSCPDMCPMTMADLKRAREQVGPDLADRTTVAFVTLDPARDDPRSQRRYLEFFFDGDFLALQATDEEALDEAAERFGVRYEVADHEPGARQYEVSHTAITYVVDDTGHVVRELPFGAPAEDYARIIEASLTDP
jgi:protein SCO1